MIREGNIMLKNKTYLLALLFLCAGILGYFVINNDSRPASRPTSLSPLESKDTQITEDSHPTKKLLRIREKEGTQPLKRLPASGSLKNYSIYKTVPIGLEISYPQSMVVSEWDVPDYGDISFADEHANFYTRIYINNVTSENIAEKVIADQYEDEVKRYAGFIEKNSSSKSGYILKWTSESLRESYYKQVILVGNAYVALIISYPTDDKAEFVPIVEHMVSTFKPGKPFQQSGLSSVPNQLQQKQMDKRDIRRFRQDYEKNLQAINPILTVPDIEMTPDVEIANEGIFPSFWIKLGDGIGMKGTLERGSYLIHDIGIISLNGAGVDDGSIFTLMSVLAQTLNPGYTISDGAILLEGLAGTKNVFSSSGASKTTNGKIYRLSAGKMDGYVYFLLRVSFLQTGVRK